MKRRRSMPHAGRPRALPEVEGPEWRRWIHGLGRQLRRMREVSGLSQDQLARLAGVSQGAVSRLETARGMATPLVVVMKISLAVTRELRATDPALLDDDVRHAIDMQDALLRPLATTGAHALRIPGDPDLQKLVEMYHALAPRQRVLLVAVLRSVAAALGSEE